jgi:hypothetical protein
MANTLDQDVHALKDWLRRAWRYLADPSMTCFGRQELRNYMREAEAALRAGQQQLSDRDKARRDMYEKYSSREVADFRVLTVLTPGESALSAAGGGDPISAGPSRYSLSQGEPRRGMDRARRFAQQSPR